jgi:hypothetical protein
MLITAILVLGINVIHRQVCLLWSSNEISRPVYHDSRLLIETLRQELSCLYFPPIAEGAEGNCFDLSTSANGKTDLIFYTLTPLWKGGLQASRIARVRYTLTFDEDAGKTLLERFEQSCAGEKLIGAESSDIIMKGLSGFEISVLPSNSDVTVDKWKQTYSSRDAPPRVLKILLKWPAIRNAEELNFQTEIFVPCQLPLKP